MNLRKLLAIILALVLAFAAFSTLAEDTRKDYADPDDWTPYFQWADALDDNTVSYDEPVHLSIASAYLNGGNPDYNTGDIMAQWFCQHFNMELEVIPLDNADYNTKIRTMLAGGDWPDIVKWYDYYPEEIINYVNEQELFKPFPEDWREKFPHLARAQDMIPIYDGLHNILGGDYMFFRDIFLNYAPYEHGLTDQDVMYMRKDWMEAVGFEVKDAYTRQEILDFARLLKEKDPGEVGDSLVPIAGSMNYFRKLFIRHDYADYKNLVKGDDGYYWSFAQPEVLEGLKVFKTAYVEGLISPEFFSHSDEDGHAMFAYSLISGMDFDHSNTGHIWDRMSGLIENGLVGDDASNWENVVHMAPIKGEDGYHHGMESDNFWGLTFFNADCSDVQVERWLAVSNFVFSDQGQNFCWFGFENFDYAYDENGKACPLLLSAPHRGVCCQLWRSMSTCGDELSFAPLSMDQKTPRDLIMTNDYLHVFEVKDAMWNDDCIVKIDIPKSAFNSETQDRFSAIDVDAFIAELIVDKDGDLEASWNAFIEENQPVVQAAIDELNTELLGM